MARRQGGGLLLTVLTILTALPPRLGAQSIAQRIGEVTDGKVRMSYATREGVCGNGRNITTSRSTEDWEGTCEAGPARVVLTWRAGALVDVDTYVGGRWRAVDGDVLDLGTVSAPEAAAYLLSLAGRSRDPPGEDLVFPATLADSVEVWPQLLALARDADVPRETRKSAVFWLGQAAGSAVVDDLADLADDRDTDREIQKHAVFALSQLRNGGGVEALIDVARSHHDPHVRKAAMFWLGQTNDMRAVALFEEILLSR